VDRIIWVAVTFQKVMNRNKILHSFQKSGQVKTGWTDFLDSKMRLCKTKIDGEQYKILRNSFDFHVKEFREHGKITEESMDAKNIPIYVDEKERSTLPKDKRVLHTQRCLIINHQHIIVEYDNYLKRKTDKLSKAQATKKKRITEQRSKMKSNSSDDGGEVQNEQQYQSVRSSARKRKVKVYEDFICDGEEE
jgi:hypothetical protein